MRFASATGCFCCRHDRRGFSPNCQFAHHATRAAKPRSLRSKQRSHGGPMAIARREMSYRQRLRRVLKYVSEELAMKRAFGGAALSLGLLAVTAMAQDMMRGVDLSSPDMVSAEMTRTQVETAIATAATAPADFTGKRLSNLDLSGLDLSRAILRRAGLNKTKLAGENLDHAILDQAWLLEADLTGATLRGASIFAAQMARAHLDG